jgi:hypothetical protein
LALLNLEPTHDIPVGIRHLSLFDEGRKYWYAYHRSKDLQHLIDTFMIWNNNRTQEPLPRNEVYLLAKGIYKWTEENYTGIGEGTFTDEDRLHSAEKRKYIVEKRRKEIAEFFFTYGKQPDFDEYFIRWRKSKRTYYYDLAFIKNNSVFEDDLNKDADTIPVNLVFFQMIPHIRIQSWGVKNFCENDHPDYFSELISSSASLYKIPGSSFPNLSLNSIILLNSKFIINSTSNNLCTDRLPPPSPALPGSDSIHIALDEYRPMNCIYNSS